MKMRKTYIMCLLAGVLCACEDWTDKNFDVPETVIPDNVISKGYTLTDVDYSTISAFSIDGIHDYDLAVVKTNCFLTPRTPADLVLPLLMANKYYAASDGTSVTVTYRESAGEPEYLARIGAARKYTVSAADYAKVWGDSKTPYFTPSHSAEANLSAILKKGASNVIEGGYALVTYEYSANEPSSGGEVAPAYDPISKVISDGTAGTAYSIAGRVIGVYAQGALVKDETGTMLAYAGSKYEGGVEVGDSVTVAGSSSLYGGLWQLGSAVITKVSSDASFVLPEADVVSGAYLDGFLNAPEIRYIKYSGTLKIKDSGKGYSYYNIEDIDGAVDASGALQYPTTEMIAKLIPLDNKRISVTGYAIGFSKKIVNLMVTEVEEEMPYSTISEVLAMPKNTECRVKGTVVGEYARGILLKDETGMIMVYGNTAYDGACEIGEQVGVYGKSDTYGLGQIGSPQIYHIANGSFTQPAPETLDAAGMDACFASPSLKYVSYTGILKAANASGADIDVEGSDVNGRVQYPLTGAIDAALVGKKVTITGYILGENTYKGQKQVNTLLISIAEEGVVPAGIHTFTSSRGASLAAMNAVVPETRAAASVSETRLALYRFNGTDWSAVDTAAVVKPADYAAMGSENLYFSEEFKADDYLPAFMAMRFPLVKEGAVRTAVYHYYYASANETGIVADNYKYTAGKWEKYTEPVEEVVANCMLDNGVWFVVPEAIFKEDFESLDAELKDYPGWTWLQVTGTKSWYRGAYKNNHYASCSAFNGSGVHDLWLITPTVELPDAYDLNFSFDWEMDYYNAMTLKVLISTDFTGDETKATWVDITDQFTLPEKVDGYGVFVPAGEFDLKEYLGKKINIAFRYEGDPDNLKTTTFKIDNLLISSKL